MQTTTQAERQISSAYKIKMSRAQEIECRLFLRRLIDKIPCRKPNQWISHHAEAHRVMPAGSRFPGPLNLNRTPYVREPMDNMSPMSPIQKTAIMKGAQGGFTMSCAECVICYHIGYNPADQLYLTATDSNLRKWASRRLEPAIDTYGYREFISSQSKRPANKQTGDTIYSKQYPGGQLDMASARSAANLRSDTKKVLVRDEVSASREQLDTGEGSWLKVSEARTFFWGTSRKIMDISTPIIAGQDPMEDIHAIGDQRVYMTPCPHCQKYQVLKFRGFKPDTVAGRLNDVYYLCEFCHEALFNDDKLFMLPGGHWEPTNSLADPYTRSYHWAAWLAPIGAINWKQIFTQYQAAVASGKPEDMKEFVTLCLGVPYRDKGSRPSKEKVLALQGFYKAGTVPHGVLFLTMAVDVQQGSKKDKKNPSRLELEICGHGAGYRTWSVFYKRIEGEVKTPLAGAWEELEQWSKENELTFYRKDGMPFSVKMILVDSGDGTMTDTVYKFTQRWQNTYPISGFHDLQKRKGEKGDELTSTNLKRFRFVKSGDLELIQISTNFYKTALYSNLHIERLGQEFEIQAPGFCDFPVDYPPKYFDMLRAEEQRKDGSFHAGGRRNESLDCRVYNLCAADVFLARLVESFRQKYKKQYKPEELKTFIDYKFALEYLSKKVGVEYE